MLGVAADSSDYFKVKEINALLQSKGVKPRGEEGPEMQATRPRLHGRGGAQTCKIPFAGGNPEKAK